MSGSPKLSFVALLLLTRIGTTEAFGLLVLAANLIGFGANGIAAGTMAASIMSWEAFALGGGVAAGNGL